MLSGNKVGSSWRYPQIEPARHRPWPDRKAYLLDGSQGTRVLSGILHDGPGPLGPDPAAPRRPHQATTSLQPLQFASSVVFFDCFTSPQQRTAAIVPSTPLIVLYSRAKKDIRDYVGADAADSDPDPFWCRRHQYDRFYTRAIVR